LLIVPAQLVQKSRFGFHFAFFFADADLSRQNKMKCPSDVGKVLEGREGEENANNRKRSTHAKKQRKSCYRPSICSVMYKGYKERDN
jgi:hypothetical protein